MADLAEIGIKVDSRQVKSANTELNKFSKEGSKAQKAATGMSTAVKALGAALAAVGISRLIRGVVDANLAMESINSSLAVATGSAEGAAREFQFLREQSERLGLDLRTSSDAFASLAAAARGTALEGQGARDIFIGVSEAMTALGRDSYATEGALRAIEQMISKGNVSAEELRGQLGERLPGAFNLAAKAMGVTTQELNKMLDNGELLAADLLPRLARELSATFSEQAIQKADGLQAQMNRFRTAVFDLMTSGNMDGLASAIGDVTELISDPGFQQGFSALISGIVKIAEVGGKAAAGLGTVGTMIGETVARMMGYETLVDQILSKEDELESARITANNARTQVAKRNAKERVEALESELNALRRLHEMSVSQVGMASNNRPTPSPAAGALTQPPRTASPTAAREFDLGPVLRPQQDEIETVDLYTEQREAAQDAFEQIRQSLLSVEEAEIESFNRRMEMIREYARMYPAEQEKANSLAEKEIERHSERMAELTEQTTGEMSEFVRRAAENMQDAMSKLFFDAMQGDMGNLEQSFKRMIDKMVAELLASQLLDFVKDTAMGGGFGEAIAGIAASAFGGARANGGPVMAGTSYMVGERGPEMFVPSQTGSIVPNNQVSNKVVVNINVTGVKDEGGLRKTSAQVAQAAGRASQRAMARNS